MHTEQEKDLRYYDILGLILEILKKSHFWDQHYCNGQNIP